MRTTLLVIIFIPFVCLGQKKMICGAYVGYSNSWSSFSSVPPTLYNKSLGSLIIGLNLDYKITNNVSFHPEMNFSDKGYTNTYYSVLSVGDYYKTYYSFHTISLPLLMKVKFSKLTSPFLLLGVSPNIVIASNIHGNTNADSISSAGYLSNLKRAKYNSFDVPITLGIGFQFPYHKKVLLDFGVRLNYGLINIFPNSNNGRLYSFNFLFGFSFLSKKIISK